MILIEIGALFTFFGGLLFKLFRPKTINYIYGYRSKFSMKNQNTWDVAQRYSANIFIISGLLLILLGVIQHIIFNESNTMNNIQGIEVIFSVLVIYIICEKHLRSKFYENGSQK